MQTLYPSAGDSAESAEGTAAHALGELFLSSILRGLRDWPKRSDVVGASAPNAVIWDDEMYEAAELYGDTVNADAGELRIEQRVTMPQIHPTHSFGTLDAYRVDRTACLIRIYDFKYGRRGVDPFENFQLVQYALGVCNLLNIDGFADQFWEVELVIVQPRHFCKAGPVKRWRTKLANLRGLWNILSQRAHAAMAGGKCTTGPHCGDCTARANCPAALQAGAQLFEAAAQPVPVELSPLALGVQLSLIRRAMELLEDLEEVYEQRVESTIRSGQAVPGWMHEQRLGRQRWKVPASQVYALGQLAGKDLRADTPITPKQAIKLGIDVNVVTAYSETPTTGAKIVPVNSKLVKKVFS